MKRKHQGWASSSPQEKKPERDSMASSFPTLSLSHSTLFLPLVSSIERTRENNEGYGSGGMHGFLKQKRPNWIEENEGGNKGSVSSQ